MIELDWNATVGGPLGPAAQFTARLLETCGEQPQLQIVSAHPGGKTLIVSHGGSLRTLRRHATGRRAPPMGNCELFALAYRDGVACEVEG